MSRRAKISALTVVTIAVLAALVPWPSGRLLENGTESSPDAMDAPELSARPERAWPFEALPELGFDQALSLLANEARRLDEDDVGIERIRTVARRIDELHRRNLREISRAASYYATLSPAARERFATFRSEYLRRHDELGRIRARLESGEKAAAEELVVLLRETGAWQPPRSLPRAKDLPRRRLFTPHREPRGDDAAWRRENEEKTTWKSLEKEAGWLETLFGQRTAHAQDAGDEPSEGDDLAESLEVRFRPESAPAIQELLDAENLRGSPARIVNWVRDHIELVPIWGGLQSSVTCLETRKGTAIDIASLTIALLRASGIRARYQAGTVRLPIDVARNWLGNFTDAHAAASLLASGGTPAVVQVDSDGEPVALRFEHVWVRAFIDYTPSRGACHVEGDTWVDLDTSIRTYRYFASPDLTELMPWDSPDDVLDQFLEGATLDEETGAVSNADFRAFRAVTDGISARSDEIIDAFLEIDEDINGREAHGLGRVIPSRSTVVSAAPRFEVLARGRAAAEVGDEDRFAIGVNLRLGNEEVLRFGLPSADLGSSRLSLVFRSESAVDDEILGRQILERDVPTGRFFVAGVRLLPELRRDGKIVATGSAVPMGAALELEVDYDEPVLSTPPITKRIVAAETTAIGLDLLAVPPGVFSGFSEEFQRFISWYENGDEEWRPKDLTEALLSTVVHFWFAQVDGDNTILGSHLDCPTHRYPSAGFCSKPWTGEALFGLPLAASPRELVVDIPGDVTLLVSRSGDTVRMARTNLAQGLRGSALEGYAPMQVLNTLWGEEYQRAWVGSTTTMYAAMRLGDGVTAVSRENIDRVLPRLRLAVEEREEIGAAVDRGFTVFTHLNSVADQAGCLAGYVILDESTGNAIYRMSGGLCGGYALDCINAANKLPDDLDFPTRTDKGEADSIADRLSDQFYGIVREEIDENFTAGGLAAAMVRLLEMIEKTDDYNAERLSRQRRKQLPVLLYTLAYEALEEAVYDRAGERFHQARGQLPSMVMGIAFETMLQELRVKAQIAGAEAGINVPCVCFCDEDCAEGWFENDHPPRKSDVRPPCFTPNQ